MCHTTEENGGVGVTELLERLCDRILRPTLRIGFHGIPHEAFERLKELGHERLELPIAGDRGGFGNHITAWVFQDLAQLWKRRLVGRRP